MKPSINLYLGNHINPDASSDHFIFLQYVFNSRGIDVKKSNSLIDEPGVINIIIDGFDNEKINQDIIRFYEDRKNSKVFIFLTEFIEKRFAVISFNNFAGIFEAAYISAVNFYLKFFELKNHKITAIDLFLFLLYLPISTILLLKNLLNAFLNNSNIDIRSRVYRSDNKLPPIFYRHKRFLGLLSILKYSDGFLCCSLDMFKNSISYIREKAGSEKLFFEIYPELSESDISIKKSNVFSLQVTGTINKYRENITKKIRKILIKDGKSIEVEFYGFDVVDNQKEKPFYSLHPPQSSSWKYCSPVRIFRAIFIESTVPLLTKKFNQHPIEDMAILVGDKNSASYVSGLYGNKDLINSYIENFVEHYLQVAKKVNDNFVTRLDSILENLNTRSSKVSDQNSQVKLLLKFVIDRRRKQIIFMLILMVAVSFFEVISISSILPFINILIGGDNLYFENFSAKVGLNFLGTISEDNLIVFFTSIFISINLLAAMLRLTLLKSLTNFSFQCGSDMAIKIYGQTLSQPYHEFIRRNSSEYISAITMKITDVVFLILLPLLTTLSSMLLVISISATLFYLNYTIAFISFALLSIFYIAISFKSRKMLAANSQRISEEQTKLIKILNEGLGGFRDIYIDGTQNIFINLYKKADRSMRSSMAGNVIIQSSPRFIMEALAACTIALSVLIAQKNSNIQILNYLPTIGALVIGLQKLLPAVQQVYSAWGTLLGNRQSLSDVVELMNQPQQYQNAKLSSQVELRFDKEITLSNVCFSHSSKSPEIFNGINLNIYKGEKIGVIGSTGSGKSTLLDIVMGLLSPTRGEVLVDGVQIEGRQSEWHKFIAHVPQYIFIADASLLENIAFGIPRDQIDRDKVSHVLKLAKLEDLVNTFEAGLDQMVGERGIRLSGGQRQRIGVARALYKESKVLIFDEATSALDSNTESLLMQEIYSVSDVTLIMVAHRLSTLKNCDRIVEIEDGLIKKICNFGDLKINVEK